MTEISLLFAQFSSLQSFLSRKNHRKSKLYVPPGLNALLINLITINSID